MSCSASTSGRSSTSSSQRGRRDRLDDGDGAPSAGGPRPDQPPAPRRVGGPRRVHRGRHARRRTGRFAGANGSVRDMRERDRLERDLRASEDRYRNLASSSPDMVFATDAEGRYTFLSDRASTMLGWDLERHARPRLLRATWRPAGRAAAAQLPGRPRRPDDRPLRPHGLPRRRRRAARARDQRPRPRSRTAWWSGSTASRATSRSGCASSAS